MRDDVKKILEDTEATYFKTRQEFEIILGRTLAEKEWMEVLATVKTNNVPYFD